VEREALERLQDGYNELKSQLHNCPESLREQLQEQLKRVSDCQEHQHFTNCFRPTTLAS